MHAGRDVAEPLAGELPIRIVPLAGQRIVQQQGLADLIGCARPSIAGPFLPKKIEEGRFEDVRECIGCNVCVSGDFTMSPLRCTQNPAMGEEWRKGWHPERIRAKASDRPVLVVGAGPAGLEAAQALGKRGYEVTLAEKGTALGGRVTRECRLPGLSAWARVRDYREQQLHKLANVQVYFDSGLDADAVMEFGFPRIVVATGARWRKDGVGRQWTRPMPTAREGQRPSRPGRRGGGRELRRRVRSARDGGFGASTRNLSVIPWERAARRRRRGHPLESRPEQRGNGRRESG